MTNLNVRMFKYTNLYFGFPWPAPAILKHTLENTDGNWCFILPPGPCGLGPALHIFKEIKVVTVDILQPKKIARKVSYISVVLHKT